MSIRFKNIIIHVAYYKNMKNIILEMLFYVVNLTCIKGKIQFYWEKKFLFLTFCPIYFNLRERNKIIRSIFLLSTKLCPFPRF